MSLLGVPWAAGAKRVHGRDQVEQLAARQVVRAAQHLGFDTGVRDRGQEFILARVRGEPHDRSGGGTRGWLLDGTETATRTRAATGTRTGAGQRYQPAGPGGSGFLGGELPRYRPPDQARRAADDRAIRREPCGPREAPPMRAG